MSIEIPQESVEFLRADVQVDGVTPTTGVTFAIKLAGARPAPDDYSPGTLDAGTWVILVAGLVKGWYDVWIRIDATPEVPVQRLRNVFVVV